MLKISAISKEQFLRVLYVIIISFLVILFLWLACSVSLFALLLSIYLIIIFFFFNIKHSRKTSFFDFVLIILLIILICARPISGDPKLSALKEEIVSWNKTTKGLLEACESLVINREGVTYKRMPSAELNQTRPELEATKEPIITENLISDGSFRFPLSSWGHGYYSNVIREQSHQNNLFWINFRNADIQAFIEETKKRSVLKIVRKSPKDDNVVGIVEQYIKVENTGTYELSFWAKAEDLELDALQMTTTIDWIASKERGGYLLEKSGTFNWEHFKAKIELKEQGTITFTIASLGKGTIYITELSLVKITDNLGGDEQ